MMWEIIVTNVVIWLIYVIHLVFRKTCVFEMAMGRLFQGELDRCKKHKHQHHHGQHPQRQQQIEMPNCRKIVYISPSKALCQERYQDWSTRLPKIHPGLECVMFTGDANSDIASAHVILTTPEKWDSITRKWTDNLYLIGSVKLLLIDEVHLLGDGSRGGCLETIICRMKTVQRAAVRVQQQHQKAHKEERRMLSRFVFRFCAFVVLLCRFFRFIYLILSKFFTNNLPDQQILHLKL